MSDRDYFTRWKDKYKAGLSCEICGYTACPDALVFHHIVPKQGGSSPSRANTIRKFLRIVSECACVCANCHAEIHAGWHGEYLRDEGIGNGFDKDQLGLWKDL